MSQMIDAVYEKGILRPLGSVDLAEGQQVRLSVEPAEPKLAPDEVLRLARRVYADLTEAEIDAVEAVALDRTRFFAPLH
jgi:predicted DNA-binding antitoxin AbrB/MazE fold protein